MSLDLARVMGPARLNSRLDAEEEEAWRYAGEQLGLDLNAQEGLSNLGLDDLRRLRSDKVVPRSFGSELGQASREMTAYEATGSYQPEVAFGV